MFDSSTDWLIIAVAAGVLLYGSTKIPQLARNLGRSTGEFKRGRLEVEKEIKADQISEARPLPAGTSPPVAPGSSR